MALRPMVVLTALCIACIPGHAVAQDVTRIRPVSAPTGRPASPGHLMLEEVFAIGSLQGEHDAFGRVMDIAVDRRGRIYVADDAQRHIKGWAGRYRHLTTGSPMRARARSK